MTFFKDWLEKGIQVGWSWKFGGKKEEFSGAVLDTIIHDEAKNAPNPEDCLKPVKKEKKPQDDQLGMMQ